MPKKLSKADVPAWCLAWQTALGLTDWDIEVSLVPHAQLITEHGDIGIMGACRADDAHKVACIQAIDPVDGAKMTSDLVNYDLEYTLLHEHLHVCFDELDRVFENMLSLLGGEARALMRHTYNSAQEQLINQLTKAFMRVKK